LGKNVSNVYLVVRTELFYSDIESDHNISSELPQHKPHSVPDDCNALVPVACSTGCAAAETERDPLVCTVHMRPLPVLASLQKVSSSRVAPVLWKAVSTPTRQPSENHAQIVVSLQSIARTGGVCIEDMR
jgi:hypothetical protein